ncbi:MAG: hypothetical protein KDB40_07870 [Acidimicrobiales bacterium]|nr:hypothetical protein [Acidimicrobiales bacterium]
MNALARLRTFDRRRWLTAIGGTLGTALVLGLPTDVIPNPVFGRPVPVTWWSYPVLAITSVLGGLLLATYVRETSLGPVASVSATPPVAETAAPGAVDVLEDDRPARLGGIGGALSFFAIGCPVCNKLVVVALGTVGARQWFEPFQPVLAVISIVVMAVALRSRLRNADACPMPRRARRAFS